MKTVLAIRHVHFEGLGILEAELQKNDFKIKYIEAPTTDFKQLNPLSDDLVVVLGAPIGAFDERDYPFISDELEFIRKRLEEQKPILGICLGAQFIARLLGAKVYSMGVKEIGFSKVSLTDAGEKSPLSMLAEVPVLHWHGDQFDIPASCERLAFSNICANQAFSYGNKILGLQFHMEADPDKIEQWLVGHACELSSARIDLNSLRKDAAQYGDQLKAAGKKVFHAWLHQAGLMD